MPSHREYNPDLIQEIPLSFLSLSILVAIARKVRRHARVVYELINFSRFACSIIYNMIRKALNNVACIVFITVK